MLPYPHINGTRVNFHTQSRIQEDPWFFHDKWTITHRFVWSVPGYDDNTVRLSHSQYSLINVQFGLDTQTFFIRTKAEIAFNLYFTHVNQFLPRSIKLQELTIPEQPVLYGQRIRQPCITYTLNHPSNLPGARLLRTPTQSPAPLPLYESPAPTYTPAPSPALTSDTFGGPII